MAAVGGTGAAVGGTGPRVWRGGGQTYFNAFNDRRNGCPKLIAPIKRNNIMMTIFCASRRSVVTRFISNRARRRRRRRWRWRNNAAAYDSLMNIILQYSRRYYSDYYRTRRTSVAARIAFQNRFELITITECRVRVCAWRVCYASVLKYWFIRLPATVKNSFRSAVLSSSRLTESAAAAAGTELRDLVSVYVPRTYEKRII